LKLQQFIIKKFSQLYGNEDQRNFATRFQFGIPKIRDNVFSEEKEKGEFDSLFTPVVHNLEEMLFAKDSCLRIIEDYKKKLEEKSEEFIKTSMIDEGISFDLNMFFKDFFIRGKIAIDNTIKVASFLGFKIDFFFQEDKKFDEKSKRITSNTHQIFKRLVDHMRTERNCWVKGFQDMRNQIEHHGFQIPSPQYSLNSDRSKIQVHFLRLEKSADLEKSLQALWNNLSRLIEDVISLLLATKIKHPFALICIPKQQRDKKVPVKYKVDLLPNGVQKI